MRVLDNKLKLSSRLTFITVQYIRNNIVKKVKQTSRMDENSITLNVTLIIIDRNQNINY